MTTVELEKETLEEEKQGTIFSTEMFNHIYNQLIEAKSKLREELQNVLGNGVIEFVKSKIQNTEPLNEEAIRIAFNVGVATVLGGDMVAMMRKDREKLVAQAMKRVIGKENMIGFNFNFENGNKGACILPKEQYEELSKTHSLEEIISRTTDGKKFSNITPMSDEELDKALEMAADEIVKGENNG